MRSCKAYPRVHAPPFDLDPRVRGRFELPQHFGVDRLHVQGVADLDAEIEDPVFPVQYVRECGRCISDLKARRVRLKDARAFEDKRVRLRRWWTGRDANVDLTFVVRKLDRDALVAAREASDFERLARGVDVGRHALADVLHRCGVVYCIRRATLRRMAARPAGHGWPPSCSLVSG